MSYSNVNQIAEGNQNLTLFQLINAAQSWFETGLMPYLHKHGGESLGYADLKLLANLDCGTTYASELSRRMGVSRQAVNKLIKNLVEARLVRLEAVPGKRNTKWIVITESGRKTIMDIVAELNRMESLLKGRVGAARIAELRAALEADWGPAEIR